MSGIFYYSKSMQKEKISRKQPFQWNQPDIVEIPKGPERWKRDDLFKIQRPTEIIDSRQDLSSIRPSHHRGSSPKVTRKTLLFSWMAAFVDFWVCCSIGFLFLATAGIILNADFMQIYEIVFSWQSAVAISFSAAIFCYMVLVRSFTARTVGDWAWGLRLGGPEDFQKANYSLKVFLRIFIILASGVVTLPILSIILGQDLAGKLSGLTLRYHLPI